MAKKAINFKSMEAERKYMAHGNIHGEFARSPGNTPVTVGGKAHKVDHSHASSHMMTNKEMEHQHASSHMRKSK